MSYYRKPRNPAISTMVAVVVIIIVVIIAGVGFVLYSGVGGGKTTVTETTSIVTTTTSLQTSGPSPSSQTPTSITFLFPFTPGPREVAYYTALARGYYAAAGLSVTFVVGQGSGTVMTLVSSGAADMGYTAFSSVVIGVSKGLNAKAVFDYVDGSTLGFATFVPMSSPKDLEGRSYGSFQGSADVYLLPYLMKQAGANFSKVTLDLVNPANLYTGFLSGQYNVTAAFADDYQVMIPQTTKTIHEYTFCHFNFCFPGYMMVASQTMIQQHPAAVAAFINATIYGMMYAIQNPSTAVGYEARYQPSTEQALVQQEFETTLSYLKTSLNYTNNYGTFNSTEIQNGIQLVSQAYNITQAISSSTVYTTQFLPSQSVSITSVLNQNLNCTLACFGT